MSCLGWLPPLSLQVCPCLRSRQGGGGHCFEGRTESGARALIAKGTAGEADCPAVKKDSGGGCAPVLFWNEAGEVVFDSFGIVGSGKSETPRDPPHMGINEDRRFGKSMKKNDAGGLSSDTREGDELFHGVGDLAMVAGEDGSRKLVYVLSLSPKESRGAKDCLQRIDFCSSECFRGGEAGKELRSDAVNHPVGRLGGENGGHEQLEGIVEVEFNPGGRD